MDSPAGDALKMADAADVTERLKKRESEAQRHAFWAVMGVSPVGLIPLVATASEFGVAALVGGMLIISVREALRAMRARSEASELREKLHSLNASWTSSTLEAPPSMDERPGSGTD